MAFHLLIRYPLIYSLKSLTRFNLLPIIFFIIQGYVRFISMIFNLFKLYLKI